ncbi:MAG: GreA/GreB family elongation factor [Elusimicrobiales bacterium]
MNGEKLYVTRQDYERLCSCITAASAGAGAGKEELREFAEELSGRKVVDQLDVDAAVVTMCSRVRVMDIYTKESTVVTLVYPEDADLSLGKLSVLTPMGTAMLGRSVGDVFEWRSPAKLRRLLIREVCYQPEAAGNYNL